MSKCKTIILRTAGTNCDKEAKLAMETVGAQTEFVHINQIIRKQKKLKDYNVLFIPGGFSYGDDVASGKILANEIKFKIFDQVKDFSEQGKIIIGICNGFQVLVKAGLLPGPTLKKGETGGFYQTATLTNNDSGKFECRWIHLKFNENTRCVFMDKYKEVITLPIAHGEGKFIADNSQTLNRIIDDNYVVFSYVDENGNPDKYPVNPNGSVADIAGITNESGNIFGMMPHPERFISRYQHPFWTRLKKLSNNDEGDGLELFRNLVNYVKKNL